MVYLTQFYKQGSKSQQLMKEIDNGTIIVRAFDCVQLLKITPQRMIADLRKFDTILWKANHKVISRLKYDPNFLKAFILSYMCANEKSLIVIISAGHIWVIFTTFVFSCVSNFPYGDAYYIYNHSK